MLDASQRLLILVDAVNITKNLFIRTYKIGNHCCERKSVRVLKVLNGVFKSLQDLLKATDLNFVELVKQTKLTLNETEHYKVNAKGLIEASDVIG